MLLKKEQNIVFDKRKREKRVQELMTIRERNRLRLENARRVGSVADEVIQMSNTVVDFPDLEGRQCANVEKVNALPVFQVGEIVSVQGDTREGG